MKILKFIKEALTVPDNFFDFRNPVVWTIIVLGSCKMWEAGINDLDDLPRTKSKFIMKPEYFLPRKIHEYPHTPEAR